MNYFDMTNVALANVLADSADVIGISICRSPKVFFYFFASSFIQMTGETFLEELTNLKRLCC